MFVQEDSTALSSTSDDSSRRLHDEIRWYATLQRFRRTARIFQFSTLVLPCPDSECRVVNPTRCTARSLLAKRGKKRVLPTFARRRCSLVLHSNGERDTCSRTCILRGSCLHHTYIDWQFGLNSISRTVFALEFCLPSSADLSRKTRVERIRSVLI